MAYSGPRMKLRANVRIPARVVSGPGISQTIASGVLTTGLDLTSLSSAGTIADPSQFRLFVYNDALDEWEYTTLNNVPTTTTGDGRTGRGDADYTISNLDRYVGLTATLTAPRTWTLPAASSVPAGTRIALQDEAGGISATNTITIGVTGADTINGSSTFLLRTSRAGVEFRSDGTSKWSTRDVAVGADGLVLLRSGSTLVYAQVQTAGIADKAITLAKQADIATASVLGRKTAGTGVQEVLSGTDLRDSIIPNGFVVDRAYAEYTTNAALTTQIPTDDTIPQNTEGTQILTVSITPKSTTNRIRVRFEGEFSLSTGGSCSAALFVNSGANAVRAVSKTIAGAGYFDSLALTYEFVPGATTSQTFNLRVGPNVAGTMRMNGDNAARYFGGAMASTLVVDEIKA